MGFSQIYKLLHSKGNHKQKEKTTYETGENICERCNQHGLTLKDIQAAHVVQFQKNK